MLTPVEIFVLNWLAAHGVEADARRARILLLAAREAPAEAIAEALGLEAAEAVSVVGVFARHRLGDFARPRLTLDELLAGAQVEPAHGQHVADLAVGLFDFTLSLHRLPARLRRTVELAGLLHNAGLSLDAPNHHVVGRDLLRAVDIADVPATPLRLIACAVGFHRKSVHPDADPGFAALNRSHQRQALAIAALVRVADGLDYSQSQSTQLLGVVVAPDAVTLRLTGSEAESDAARARKKADLWEDVFHLPLRTQVESEAAPGTERGQAVEAPLNPQSSLAALLRRALALNLQRWQSNESAAVAGETDAIKAVRVSARRLRAALIVFAGFLRKKRVRPMMPALRQAERLLGRVRNIDVRIADAREYHAGVSKKGEAAHIAALIAVWEKEREAAIKEARAWLGSPEAADLQAALAAFMADPPLREADLAIAPGVAEALGILLDKAARRQGKLRPNKPASYHRLRLAFKRIRYTLEFLQPVIQAGADELIADLVLVQDRLGALNDAHLLQIELERYLDEHAERQAKRKAPQLEGAQGVLAYAQTRRAAWGQRLKEFAQAWGPVKATKLKQRVGATLRALRTP